VKPLDRGLTPTAKTNVALRAVELCLKRGTDDQKITSALFITCRIERGAEARYY
jgi:hypothetical protein